MLLGFDMAKCVLHCIGKFIKGSGLDDALIETGVFRSKIIEAVLAGTHYVRSFRGMLILSSTIFSLKLSAFFEIINDDEFNEINEKLKELSSYLSEKDKYSAVQSMKTDL